MNFVTNLDSLYKKAMDKRRKKRKLRAAKKRLRLICGGKR